MERKKMIVFELIAVVAIAAIGGGVVLLLNNNSDSTTTYAVTYETNGGDAIEKKVFKSDTEDQLEL